MMNLLNKNHPKFEPEKWNDNIFIRKSHNCYAYALNMIDNKKVKECKEKIENNKNFCKRPQPGLEYGYLDDLKIINYSSSMLINRIKSDNPLIKKTKLENKIEDGYYKICLFLCHIEDKHHQNINDFHFYRQDNNGFWSHKDGWRKATNKDKNNKLIINPEFTQKLYADNKYKYELVGYFKVPNESKYKKMSNISARF
jgi:hypothetical protein